MTKHTPKIPGFSPSLELSASALERESHARRPRVHYPGWLHTSRERGTTEYDVRGDTPHPDLKALLSTNRYNDFVKERRKIFPVKKQRIVIRHVLITSNILYLAPNPIPPPRPAFFPFFLAARLALRFPAIAGIISASAPSSEPAPIPACFDILLIMVLIF